MMGSLKGQKLEMVFRLNLSYIVWIERIENILKFVLLLNEIHTLLGLISPFSVFSVKTKSGFFLKVFQKIKFVNCSS